MVAVEQGMFLVHQPPAAATDTLPLVPVQSLLTVSRDKIVRLVTLSQAAYVAVLGVCVYGDLRLVLFRICY